MAPIVSAPPEELTMRIALLPLALLACATSGPVDSPALEWSPDAHDAQAAPLFLGLDAPAAVMEGERLVLTALGGAPGDRISFIYSLSGAGETCPPALAGGCVDLRSPKVFSTVATNVDGAASFGVTVPVGVAPARLFVQAVYVDGIDTVTSGVVPIDISPMVVEEYLPVTRMLIGGYMGIDPAGNITSVEQEGITFPSQFRIRLGVDEWTGDVEAVDQYCSITYSFDGSAQAPWDPEMSWGALLSLADPATDCVLDPATFGDPITYFGSLPYRIAFGVPSDVTSAWLSDVLADPAVEALFGGGKIDTGALAGLQYDYVYTLGYEVDPASMELALDAANISPVDFVVGDRLRTGFYTFDDALFLPIP
ncbi:MAG: hypothetical protein ACI8PZ_006903 [Myxococcota bacterium]|jgi:hypothetical protein